MRYRLHTFFSCRNGFDALGRTFLCLALILFVAGSMIPIALLSTVSYYLALAMTFYVYLRAFSRNIEKCQAQNAKYIEWRNYHKLRFQQRKTHRFYSCPQCKQHLRVPKGRGKISITCNRCGSSFVKKT